MGIASFESEMEKAEYERWLDDLKAEEERELEADTNYQAWCEEQIKVSQELQRHLTKVELLPERAN